MRKMIAGVGLAFASVAFGVGLAHSAALTETTPTAATADQRALVRIADGQGQDRNCPRHDRMSTDWSGSTDTNA
jgi:hypothetical protein